MSVYQRGNVWWFKFRFGNRLIRESAKTHLKTLAREAEKIRRRELEDRYNNVDSKDKKRRITTVKEAARAYFDAYRIRHPRSAKYCKGCIDHLVKHLGRKVLIEISEEVVKDYQTARLREGASGKSINEEVGELFRIMGKQGRAVRLALKDEKKLRLAQREDCGRALETDEEARLLAAARGAESAIVYPMILLALNTGMRDSEMRHLSWGQIDFTKRILRVGDSKTAAGRGRQIPLNSALYAALIAHKTWYEAEVAPAVGRHYIFPGGKNRRFDPTTPVTTFKTAWRNALRRAEVSIRLHDLRHTAISRLAESGAGDETIMAIAGHVSRSMLARYAHIRTEAKRKALEAIVTGRTHAQPPSVVPNVESQSESPTVH